MAHRIYLYNCDQQTNQTFDTYLGEWNYEIPLLLYPLIAEDIRIEGHDFFSDKERGIVQLRYFFNLLADTYQLHYKKAYYEPVNELFTFLEALPYDTFVLNASDVFHMREEKHQDQAKEWLAEIRQKATLYKKAVQKQDLSLLDSLFSRTGYTSFLEILQTNWVNYGLGYFEECAYKRIASAVFEENGKWGLKNAKGEILVSAIYDEIFDTAPHYDISIVEKDGKFGYLHSNGKELVPPIYDEAFDVMYGEEEPMAEIMLNGKRGILRVNCNTLVVPAEYDAIETLCYGFFGLKKDERHGVSTYTHSIVIPLESEQAYSYDYYPELFFCSQKGTSKRRYYTQEGNYLGEYVENSMVMAGACYWIKPNKLHKKSRLIDEQGGIIIDEIDQLLSIERFDALAICKAKSWQLYHSTKKKFLLDDEHILKVKAEPSAYRKQNVFIAQTSLGTGLYDADEELWLITPSLDIKAIDYLENNFLSVQQSDGYRFFDVENGLSVELYDYVSNPLNYRTDEGILFLYKDGKMFRVEEDKSIRRVEMSEYGTIYLDRYSFRGKDLTYFSSFYTRWKELAGMDAEASMDVETITKLAFDAKEKQDYQEALRLFELAAQKNDVDSWVEIGLLLTDPEIEALFDPKKGITYYEKAAKQHHAVAWNNIGALYQKGIGFSFNTKRAIKAYEKAAELGDGMALQNLGDLYYFGEHMKQDYRKALDFYQRAEKKHYYNYDKISEIYYQQRDYPNLLVYLKKDYDQSYSGIYYGILYEHGMGVIADVKKALKYYEQANAYAAYEYATQRLVCHYGEGSEFKNEKKWQRWKSFAEEHGFEIV